MTKFQFDLFVSCFILRHSYSPLTFRLGSAVFLKSVLRFLSSIATACHSLLAVCTLDSEIPSIHFFSACLLIPLGRLKRKTKSCSQELLLAFPLLLRLDRNRRTHHCSNRLLNSQLLTFLAENFFSTFSAPH